MSFYKEYTFRILPEVFADRNKLHAWLAKTTGIPAAQLEFAIIRKSIDARRKPVVYEIKVSVWQKGTVIPEEEKFFPEYCDVHHSTDVCHIIGAGPAGYFAALECLRQGIKPVVLERGKEVRNRRHDLASIFKKRIIHPHSNYCFGEGGAGTYSDGKLYTRSDKRGDVRFVLKTLIYHGASPEILIDSHPHIGTNRLPRIIENIRATILKHGGEIHFNTMVTDFILRDGRITQLECVSGEKGTFRMECRKVVLATGHSGREIYHILREKDILVEPKGFALGVRIEHPQSLIDCLQYHCAFNEREEVRKYLPAASYTLKTRVEGRGVYSFCMCPGGIIAPCATADEEVVTNGWSPSKRNNPFANSGFVVEILPEDLKLWKKEGALAGMYFQKEIERRAWEAGGKNLSAPALRLTDFISRSMSRDLPVCSYKSGIVPADLDFVLGKKISCSIREALRQIAKTVKGFISPEAVVVATESRTSSPVRIPRDEKFFYHPYIHNLFPCGEGAGYAGGIVSAAMDGINVIRRSKQKG